MCDDIKLYCCYSVNLKNYFAQNGLKYKIVALNPNNQKTFWVYVKNKELDKLLNDWSNNNANL